MPMKRNLEDLWKQVFLVGTRWDELEEIYQFNWNFSNLEKEFEEEGGILHGKKVFLFGCTEPQVIPFENEQRVFIVPVMVAIVSPFPPSDKIGMNSVQMEVEEIIPMKTLKMDWVPYFPLENRDSQVDSLKSQIFILNCTLTESALRHRKMDYCLAYFYILVFCQFDWVFDELEELTGNLLADGALSEDQKDAFKEFVKEKVREAKKANREAREARKKTVKEMSEETRRAFESMRFYKFYPVKTPDSPDLLKFDNVNRYYGRAHKIF